LPTAGPPAHPAPLPAALATPLEPAIQHRHLVCAANEYRASQCPRGRSLGVQEHTGPAVLLDGVTKVEARSQRITHRLAHKDRPVIGAAYQRVEGLPDFLPGRH